jgi:hypothetical protein
VVLQQLGQGNQGQMFVEITLVSYVLQLAVRGHDPLLFGLGLSPNAHIFDILW